MIDTVSITIWGRYFTLPVEYDCYQGESVTQEQVDALKEFITRDDWIAKAQSQVECYCKDQVLADESNSKKNNVFSYVIPECVFVKRDSKHPRVVLMCRYRYDIEHGIAIVFSTDGFVSVGSQESVL